MRRGAYTRWLQFVDSLGSWGYEPRYACLDPERQQAGFKREIKDIMAELELVASRRVWLVVDAFFRRVSEKDFDMFVVTDDIDEAVALMVAARDGS